MPAGSARPSRRDATFTPSPKMSPSSTAISPTLMPPGVTLGYCLLHLDCAADCINHTGEFDQQAITSRFNDPAPVFGDLRVDNLRPDRS